MTLGLRQGNHQPILEARSDDGDAEGKGTLSDDSVTGTVALPDGKRLEFAVTPGCERVA